MEQIVVSDIGGTHARFARAAVERGRVLDLGAPITLRTADYPSFEAALDTALPQRPPGLAIAFAGPVDGDVLSLTNSHWTLHRSALAAGALTIVNDFGAVAHAAATLGPDAFLHICGPDELLPREGVVSVVGPGTGLGVAILLRRGDDYQAIETEGGHIGFPSALARKLPLKDWALRFGRVSLERIVSGPGLALLYEALHGDEPQDATALWTAALDGSDPRALAALDMFLAEFGSAAGDFALAHGSSAVVLAGGIGARLGPRLQAPEFCRAFAAKGRMTARLEKTPVKLITHPQPGLYGAAAAFAREHVR